MTTTKTSKTPKVKRKAKNPLRVEAKYSKEEGEEARSMIAIRDEGMKIALQASKRISNWICLAPSNEVAARRSFAIADAMKDLTRFRPANKRSSRP